MMSRLGMVHGRFQPFHVGHLDYVLTALDRCHRLIVGITNPEPSEFREDHASPHRHLPESNPYSWYQRLEMVSQSLLAAGCHSGQFAIVPFHLFDPTKWASYLPHPQLVTQYVRVFSEWEENKIRLFEEHGFHVEVLPCCGPKRTEGTLIRQLIRDGRPWQHLVPEGAAKVLQHIRDGTL